MKLLTFVFFSVSTILHAAEPEYSPQAALDKFGRFALTDGTSYFTFTRDGQFKSGPMGESGRELTGTWTLADATELTVVARLGWLNGLNPPDEYRRLVFRISSLRERRAQPASPFAPPTAWFDGHWVIEELVKIPKPADAAADMQWPSEGDLEVRLKLSATVGAGGQVKFSGALQVKNLAHKAVTIHDPGNRLALTFFVSDALGNAVAPAARGKADPAPRTHSLAPRAVHTHALENLDFVTGSAWRSYDLTPGKTYRVIAVYRPHGLDGPGFASQEAKLVVPQ